jgi:hypothetical protein
MVLLHFQQPVIATHPPAVKRKDETISPCVSVRPERSTRIDKPSQLKVVTPITPTGHDAAAQNAILPTCLASAASRPIRLR